MSYIGAQPTLSTYGILLPEAIRRSKLTTTSFVPVQATGGTVTDIMSNGTSYRIHTFTGSGTFTVTSVGSIAVVDALVVAGGGGGGHDVGGGGGAGGLIYQTVSVGQQSYTVTIGGGGSGSGSQSATGSNGSNSSFGSLITCIGGGGGGSWATGGAARNGAPGGSGGGAGGYQQTGVGGSGINGQGFKGGDATSSGSGQTGGSGGGAGGVGLNSINNATGIVDGGPGLNYGIDGTTRMYAKGGRGFGDNVDASLVLSGEVNRGGGGDGQGLGSQGASGGSGIVIIRYQLA